MALRLPGLRVRVIRRGIVLLQAGYGKAAAGIFFAPAQKAIPEDGLFALFDVWQFPTLAWGDPTLPSALRRFTSEFG
ncbi:hypothetical protein ACOQJS_24125, partial [Pseudocitrobacter faecalis]